MQYTNLLFMCMALFIPYGVHSDRCPEINNLRAEVAYPRRGQVEEYWILSHAIYNTAVTSGPCIPKTARPECGAIVYAITHREQIMSELMTAGYNKEKDETPIITQYYDLYKSDYKSVFRIRLDFGSDENFAKVYDGETITAYVACETNVGWIMYKQNSVGPTANEISTITQLFLHYGINRNLLQKVDDTTGIDQAIQKIQEQKQRDANFVIPL